jgi:iron complex transport system ATP-binding protein
MALAQGGDYLFLDEPTTFLDMKHQIEVLNVLKKLNENEKKTIVMVLHDINQAAKYAHHIIAIKKGKIYFEGSIPEIMNAQRIESIFGVKGIIINEDKMNTPLFFPEEVSNV